MSYEIKRTDKEIEEVMGRAVDQLENGTKWPGMSYEEGVDAALRWVMGISDDDPMED